ncbi:MAG: CpsD/CapB family tyrosine-protein kinase [Clostridia bacterium]
MKLNLSLKKAPKSVHSSSDVAREKILNKDSDFTVVEKYKAMRTNIMFSMTKKDHGRAIVVTSSIPGEGKTTTAINLAITFAQTGARVMIVDCDLRKSRVHRYLDIEKKDGVSNVLCGFITLDQAIKKNIRENLDCITAGEVPPNPAELLESEEFGKMIDELKQRYDYIFVDTPPVTVVTDAAVAMKQCSASIVVVRKDVTTFDLLDETMEVMGNTGKKIIGVAMLGTEDSKKGYGYYKKGGKYGYKYGYKYDYRYEYKYQDNDEE